MKANMKTIVTALTLLVSITLNAQVDKATSLKLNKWKVGVSGSYDMHFDNSQQSCGQFAPGGCVEPYIQPRKSFTTGVIGSYSLWSKLEIGLGLAYSRKESAYDYNWYNYGFCGTEPIYIMTYVEPAVNYLETPLFVRYNFLKTKLNFHVETGATLTYNLAKSNFYDDQRYTLRAQGGLGMSYTIGNFLNIGATAFYKRKLTDFKRESYLSTPNSLSFELRTSFIF